MAKKKVTKKVAKKATKKTGKVSKFERREIKKKFWFSLTTKEKDDSGKLAGEIDGQIQRDEEKAADLRKEWKVKIDGKRSKLRGLLATLKAGKEFREVDCEEVKDFGKKEIRYMVGKKCMESREMTSNELQLSMGVLKGGKSDTPTVKANATVATVTELRPPVDKDVKDVINQETNAKTKTSPLDTRSSAHEELSGGGAHDSP